LSKPLKGSCLSAILLFTLVVCPKLYAAPVSYAYDNLNRLIEANYNSGQQIITYTYDAAGNMLTRTVGASFIDTDTDGLDDAWETTHFGDLTRDGSGDFDLDGFTDLEEFTADTNPNDDTDMPTSLGLGSAFYSVNESDGVINIPVERLGDSGSAISIEGQTQNGTQC